MYILYIEQPYWGFKKNIYSYIIYSNLKDIKIDMCIFHNELSN